MSLTAVVLGSWLAPQTAVPSADPFAHSYRVSASLIDRECLFQITDVLQTGSQLTASLSAYDHEAGMEVLAHEDTPGWCVRRGVRAVKRAGFHHVRVRPWTDADFGFGALP